MFTKSAHLYCLGTLLHYTSEACHVSQQCHTYSTHGWLTWNNLCNCCDKSMLCIFLTSLLSLWSCVGCQCVPALPVPCSTNDTSVVFANSSIMASSQCDPGGVGCCWQHCGVSLLSDVFHGSDTWWAERQGQFWTIESPAWSSHRPCVALCHPQLHKHCKCSSLSAWFPLTVTISCSSWIFFATCFGSSLSNPLIGCHRRWTLELHDCPVILSVLSGDTGCTWWPVRCVSTSHAVHQSVVFPCCGQHPLILSSVWGTTRHSPDLSFGLY